MRKPCQHGLVKLVIDSRLAFVLAISLAILVTKELGAFPAAPRGSPLAARDQQSHSAQSNRPDSHNSKAAARAPREMPVPFAANEMLNFRVAWTAFANAASVQLSVAERRQIFGWNTWHFRAAIRTQDRVRSLFTIDDEFDSYTDSSNFESRQYEEYLDEMGRKESHLHRFLPEGETSRAPAPYLIVMPNTRDPLGALYALRCVDWRRTPEFDAPVSDGHDVYDMSARLESAEEKVAVPAGNFTASRVSVHLAQRGKEVQGISFLAWFANDAARTPVQIQAILPFGNLHVELIRPGQ
jgi:hypothetical protein